jgi:hypothetical protein
MNNRSVLMTTNVTGFSNSAPVDGQVAALGKKNAAALQRVFRVAQRLSGLAEDKADELVSQLGEDPSVGSGSDWRWRSDIGRSPPASAP